MGDQLDKRETYGRMNVCVGVAQIAAWAALVTALHLPMHLAWKALLLVIFCLMMQGVFSLMHECFHGLGSPSPGVNRVLGVAASTIFGRSRWVTNSTRARNGITRPPPSRLNSRCWRTRNSFT